MTDNQHTPHTISHLSHRCLPTAIDHNHKTSLHHPLQRNTTLCTVPLHDIHPPIQNTYLEVGSLYPDELEIPLHVNGGMLQSLPKKTKTNNNSSSSSSSSSSSNDNNKQRDIARRRSGRAPSNDAPMTRCHDSRVCAKGKSGCVCSKPSLDRLKTRQKRVHQTINRHFVNIPTQNAAFCFCCTGTSYLVRRVGLFFTANKLLSAVRFSSSLPTCFPSLISARTHSIISYVT